MDFIYKIENDIGILEKPKLVDLAVIKKLQFGFSFDSGTLKIGNNSFDIVGFVAEVPSSRLEKGANSVKVITNGKVFPCQPLQVYNTNDGLACMVALDMDLKRGVVQLSQKVVSLENRINAIEGENIGEIKTRLNEVIEQLNKLTERVAEMEKGFDPTLI